jgi:hypothetical protein
LFCTVACGRHLCLSCGVSRSRQSAAKRARSARDLRRRDLQRHAAAEEARRADLHRAWRRGAASFRERGQDGGQLRAGQGVE